MRTPNTPAMTVIITRESETQHSCCYVDKFAFNSSIGEQLDDYLHLYKRKKCVKSYDVS